MIPIEESPEEPVLAEGEVPEPKLFRYIVDRIEPLRNRVMTELLYLTASRVSEFVTKQSPTDKTTKALGSLVGFNLATYKIPNDTLLIKIPVLKRRGHVKDKVTGQVRDRLFYKTIAIPSYPIYEPWVVQDILPWVVKKKDRKMGFDLNRMTVLGIIKDEFKPYHLDVHPHSLRHFRLSHLSSYYGFGVMELIQTAGWSYKSGLRSAGLPSGQLDTYLHANWKDQMKLLLVPLEGII